MNWRKLLIIAVAVAGFGFVGAPKSEAGGNVHFSIGFGGPVGYGYGGYYDSYYPRPVYYTPAYGHYYHQPYRYHRRPYRHVRRHFHWRHGHRYVCYARHGRRW